MYVYIYIYMYTVHTVHTAHIMYVYAYAHVYVYVTKRMHRLWSIPRDTWHHQWGMAQVSLPRFPSPQWGRLVSQLTTSDSNILS